MVALELRRDTDLWVTWVYHYAVAVYRYDRGCGQVSTIDGSTGRREPPCADPRVRLFPLAPRCCRPEVTRLELWRSDWSDAGLQRIDARVKPSGRDYDRVHAGVGGGQLGGRISAWSVYEPD